MLRCASATHRAAPLTIAEASDRARLHRLDRLEFIVDLRVGFSHLCSTCRDPLRMFRYLGEFSLDRARAEALQRRLARAIHNVDATLPRIFREPFHGLDPH